MKKILLLLPFFILLGAGCNQTVVVTPPANTLPPIATTTPSVPSDLPHIESVSPTSGPVGTIITIKGTGFTSTTNSISFGNNFFNFLPSANGESLSFTIPTMGTPCAGNKPLFTQSIMKPCNLTALQITPNTYQLQVHTSSGLSNQTIFTVTSKTDAQKITYITSTEETAKYCNGDTMNSEDYRKTITYKQISTIADEKLTPTQLIKTTLHLATTGMCQSVIDQLTISQNGNTVNIPPIDGWAGVSIVMCSCKPQVEVNLLQLPGVTKVVWQ